MKTLVFLGLVLGFAQVAQAVDIRVTATGNIQDAINQCPDNDATGCRVLLQGRSYVLTNSLFIRGKNNLTLMGATPSIRPVLLFQDDGSRAGPFDLKDNPDSVAQRPAGWKRWPIKQDNLVGGSLNTSNPYSTSGIQHNGVILIKNSRDIVIDGIVIDGRKPIGFGSLGIWDSQGYPTFYGNFGVNLFLSARVTVRNTEIKNCFAAFYIFNRNKGGALAHNNQADLDKGDLAPGSRYGEMGGHIVEYSNIHHSVWGAYIESGFDLGTTWRFNKLWQLHNTSSDFKSWMQGSSPCFDRTNAAGAVGSLVCNNSEAKNHVGGFIFLKDNVSVPERVYNNTFWKVSNLFSWGGWRGGVGHAFYNNIVASPWLDYNRDTTAFLSGNFVEYMTGFQNLTKDMSEFVRSNTFAYFPVIEANKANLSETSCPGGMNVDSCKTKLAGLKAKVWPPTRLSFQSQKVQGTQFNGNYVSPVTDYFYIDGVQYQGQERKFLFQPWTLEEPNKTIDTVRYRSNLPARQNSTPVGPVEFSYAGRDSNQIASRFGGIRGLPLADTVGRLLKLGNSSKDMTSFNNHYIKSLPLNTDTASANFLSLDWTDKGVDSVVLGDVWTPKGYSFTNASGAVAARGAVQPDGVAGVQKITVTDDQPALIVGRVATLSFNLSSSVPGLSNLQWVHGQFIPNVPVTDGLQTYTGTYAPIDIPASSFSSAPALGANVVAIQLPSAPGAYSRIDLVAAGTSATGEKVMSNLAIWLVRKSDYSFDVTFHRVKGDTTSANKVDTIRAGYPVWMRVEPMLNTTNIVSLPSDSCVKLKKLDPLASCDYAEIQNTPYVGPLGVYTIKANSMWDVDPSTVGASAIPSDGLYKGGAYTPAGTAQSSGSNIAWIQVWFTKAGMAVPIHTALALTAGKADTGKVFQGGGSIFVRPGDPYIAELRDPASYRLVGDNDSIPMIPFKAKYRATIDVKDKYGNLVDVPTKVSLGALTAQGTGAPETNVRVADLTASSGVVDVPATGTVQTFVQSLVSSFSPPLPPVNWFWLRSWIGTGATPAVGTVPDSSRVHVGKAQLAFQWAPDDSILREIRDTAIVRLSLVDGDEKVVVGNNLFASLRSGSGLVKFYLPTDAARATPLDSVDMSAGTVTLVVSSATPIQLDSLAAFNADVNSGEETVLDSVTFYYNPPPFPLVDSASFLDIDCDGKADQIRVWLKPAALGSADTLDTTRVKFDRLTLQLGSSTVTYDSTEYTYPLARKNVFAFPVKGITTGLSSLSGKVSLRLSLKRKNAADSLVLANDSAGVLAKDRVSPRVDSAVVMENYSSAQDEFYVRFTEPVTYSGTSWPLVVKSGSTVQSTTGITVVSFAVDPEALLGPNTYKVVITGNRSPAFAPLYINYSDSVQLSLLGKVVDAAGNGGDGCAAAVQLRVRSVLPSFTGAISSTDTAGRANRLTVTFSRALKAEERIDSLLISFGGSSRVVAAGSNWTSTDRMVWTLAMPDPFPYGLTRGSIDAGYGATVLVYGTNTSSSATTYLPRAGLARDNVPVVFVNLAGTGTPNITINYGVDVDTLRFRLSEPVVMVPTGTSGLRALTNGLDITMVGLSMVDSTNWIMTQSATLGQKLMPGDWALLGNKLVGSDGIAPATVNPSKALVVGGDRGPRLATYLDTNADGIADLVSMTFATALKTSPSFVFRLGDEIRTVDTSNGLVIADDRLSATANFSAMPFTKVQTFVGIQDIGTMTSVMDGVSATSSFAVADGISPVILTARMRYSSAASEPGSRDTLKLVLSEPVKRTGAQTNVVWGMQTSDARQLANLGVSQASETEVWVLFPGEGGSDNPGNGDSVRIAPIDRNGEMTDLFGNAPTFDLAKWTPVQAGQRPPYFKVGMYPEPLLVFKKAGHVDPLGLGLGTQVTTWIRPQGEATWDELTSTGVGPRTSDDKSFTSVTVGPKFDVNGPFEATALIYDNIGTFVGSKTVIVDTATIVAQGLDRGTGTFEVYIGWNGMDASGKPAASGIYMFRVVAYHDVIDETTGIKGRKMLLNNVSKIGIKIEDLK